jgi:hypothetical protein
VQDSDLRSLIRDRLGLNIDLQMTQYLSRKTAESRAPIPLIGHDARTGIPRREIFDPYALHLEQP